MLRDALFAFAISGIFAVTGLVAKARMPEQILAILSMGIFFYIAGMVYLFSALIKFQEYED